MHHVYALLTLLALGWARGFYGNAFDQVATTVLIFVLPVVVWRRARAASRKT